MPAAIELGFDQGSDAQVRGLWDRLERAGVRSLAASGHRRHSPHVSLSVGESIPVGEPVDAALASATGLWDLYRPERWIPSVTARVDRIDLVDVPTGDVRLAAAATKS